MELWQDILLHAIMSGDLRLSLHTEGTSPAEIIEQKCYQTLQRIRSVLDDDRLDDPECFRRIEEIVLAFEQAGSSGGSRHDFG